MRKLMLLGVLLLTVSVGCLILDEPAGMDLNGNGIAGEKGLFSRGGEAASAAGGVGVPFAGAVGTLLTLIGGVGGRVVAARKTKNYTAATVGLIDFLKDKAGDIATDEDIERLVLEYAPDDGSSKFGAYLKKIHAYLSEQERARGEA